MKKKSKFHNLIFLINFHFRFDLQKLIGDENQNLPIFIQFDRNFKTKFSNQISSKIDIETKFVEINVYLDTSELSDKLRKYLRLFFDCIFEVRRRRNLLNYF